MSKVHPIQKSFIAEYLTKNHAISKRDGNICRFYSPEGLYLGNQVKGALNDYIDTYTTTIYGEGLRAIFQKRTMLGRQFARIINNKDAARPFVLVNKRKNELFMDFLGKEFKTITIEKHLSNDLNLVAKDKKTGNFYFEVQDFPLKYEKTLETDDPSFAKVKFSDYKFYRS